MRRWSSRVKVYSLLWPALCGSLLCLVPSCQSRTTEAIHIRRQQELVDHVLLEFCAERYRNENFQLVSYDIGLVNGWIKHINLTLSTYESLPEDRARRLIIELVEDFLTRLYSDSRVASRFIWPFTEKNLNITITARNAYSQFADTCDIETVNQRDGIITYETFRPTPIYFSVPIVKKETYAYALMLVGRKPDRSWEEIYRLKWMELQKKARDHQVITKNGVIYNPDEIMPAPPLDEAEIDELGRQEILGIPLSEPLEVKKSTEFGSVQYLTSPMNLEPPITPQSESVLEQAHEEAAPVEAAVKSEETPPPVAPETPVPPPAPEPLPVGNPLPPALPVPELLAPPSILNPPSHESASPSAPLLSPSVIQEVPTERVPTMPGEAMPASPAMPASSPPADEVAPAPTHPVEAPLPDSSSLLLPQLIPLQPTDAPSNSEFVPSPLLIPESSQSAAPESSSTQVAPPVQPLSVSATPELKFPSVFIQSMNHAIEQLQHSGTSLPYHSGGEAPSSSPSGEHATLSFAYPPSSHTDELLVAIADDYATPMYPIRLVAREEEALPREESSPETQDAQPEYAVGEEVTEKVSTPTSLDGKIVSEAQEEAILVVEPVTSAVESLPSSIEDSVPQVSPSPEQEEVQPYQEMCDQEEAEGIIAPSANSENGLPELQEEAILLGEPAALTDERIPSASIEGSVPQMQASPEPEGIQPHQEMSDQEAAEVIIDSPESAENEFSDLQEEAVLMDEPSSTEEARVPSAPTEDSVPQTFSSSDPEIAELASEGCDKEAGVSLLPGVPNEEVGSDDKGEGLLAAGSSSDDTVTPSPALPSEARLVAIGETFPYPIGAPQGDMTNNGPDNSPYGTPPAQAMPPSSDEDGSCYKPEITPGFPVSGTSDIGPSVSHLIFAEEFNLPFLDEEPMLEAIQDELFDFSGNENSSLLSSQANEQKSLYLAANGPLQSYPYPQGSPEGNMSSNQPYGSQPDQPSGTPDAAELEKELRSLPSRKRGLDSGPIIQRKLFAATPPAMPFRLVADQGSLDENS